MSQKDFIRSSQTPVATASYIVEAMPLGLKGFRFREVTTGNVIRQGVCIDGLLRDAINLAETLGLHVHKG